MSKYLQKLLEKLDEEYEKIDIDDKIDIHPPNTGYNKVELDTQIMLITINNALKKFKSEIQIENEKTRELIRRDIHSELQKFTKNNK
jgi:hypothetical protein